MKTKNNIFATSNRTAYLTVRRLDLETITPLFHNAPDANLNMFNVLILFLKY